MKTLNATSSFARITLLVIAFFTASSLFSQTLIMNEVSNGPSGNKEYVEFVVTDTSVLYNCGLTSPPCIDIRGWIFDDNSGYHGSAGIATGAVRFSYNSLWSCVPLGTIILIYNDADPNAAIPPNDLSVSDGNCRIIAPISSILFETNLTTPGAVACSYPATGWTAGGNWSNTLLANPGDCARIVNTSGCEVFSVCWGTDNLNTLIYFSSAAGDHVYYFNNGDPTNQLNWSEGCADISTCGIDEQTPGSANNAANAAYIAQFNNGCMPITPISSSIASSTDASCGCDGTATVNASGSIPGYTYTWYDVTMTPIGQTTATATGLCPGTYHVISESSIGCTDTTTVIIASTGGTGLTVTITAPNDTTCAYGGPFSLFGSPAGGTWSGTGVSAAGQFAGSVSGPGTFTITYTATAGGCTGSNTIDITVLPANALHIDSLPPVCITDAPVTFMASPPGGFFYGTTPLTTDGVFDPGYSSAIHVIAYQIDYPGACSLWDSTFIVVMDTVATIVPVTAVCEDAAPFNLSATPAGGTWSGPGITSAAAGTFDPSLAGAGTHTITYTGAGISTCLSNGSTSITVGSGGVTASIDPVAPVCENTVSIALTATPSGGTWSGPGVSASGTFFPSLLGNGSYTVFYTAPGSGPCGGIDSVTIQVDNFQAVNITPVGTVCSDASPFALTANVGGGTWSGTGITSAAAGTFNPATAGTGTHTITYTLVNGSCTSTATVNINVVPSASISISALGPLVFCQGGSVQLTVTGAGVLPVTWSNGMTGSTITVSSSGNYYAMVNGCAPDTSNTIGVTVNTIDADFTPDPSSGTAPLEVTLQNNTTNTATYYWSVGDSVYASNADTVITFDTTGYFDITLYVVSPQGCVDSLTQTVYVYGEFALIIPNIFTPNGDHHNDVFSVELAGVKELNVLLFNRWGQEVHAYENAALTDGTTVVWDGKARNGDLSSDGTYAYVLTALPFVGEAQTYKGFITLISKSK